MAVFSVQGQQSAVTSGYKTAIAIYCAASAPRRGKIFDINMSQGSAPASTDTNIQFDLSVLTAAGIYTAGNAQTNDPADSTITSQTGVNATAEGTITANSSKFNIALNQRAPYRWQTYLGSGGELVFAATASQGLAFRVLSAGYTGQAGGTIYCQEQ